MCLDMSTVFICVYISRYVYKFKQCLDVCAQCLDIPLFVDMSRCV